MFKKSFATLALPRWYTIVSAIIVWWLVINNSLRNTSVASGSNSTVTMENLIIEYAQRFGGIEVNHG